MARKAVVDAVMGRLDAGWTGCPVAGANLGGADPVAPFIAIEFPVANEAPASTGAPGDNIWREEGVFRIILHVERGAGIAEALAWCDTLAALFRGREFDGVQCWEVTSPRLDDDNDLSGYFQVFVAVRYQHDIYA